MDYLAVDRLMWRRRDIYITPPSLTPADGNVS